MDLAGNAVIVTGSSSGIGAAVARRLSDLGAGVVVNSATSAQAGRRVAAELADAVYVKGTPGSPSTCRCTTSTRSPPSTGTKCCAPTSSGPSWSARPRCRCCAGVELVAPLHRVATPDDIADACLALIGSRYTTGQTLVVDGGLGLVI